MFSNLLYKFLTIIATIKVLVIPCFITKYTLNITHTFQGIYSFKIITKGKWRDYANYCVYPKFNFYPKQIVTKKQQQQ